jgi:Predicted transcriptional regulator
MSEIARKSGLGLQALSENGNPTLETLAAVLTRTGPATDGSKIHRLNPRG